MSTNRLLIHLQIFKEGEIMALKYGHLMLPGVYPDKVTTDIDFIDEPVVQCDFTVVAILLYVLVIYK